MSMTLLRSLSLTAGFVLAAGEHNVLSAHCATKACANQYHSILQHGCKRLRGIYELKWANRFAEWKWRVVDAKPAGQSINLDRLVPIRSEIPFTHGNRYVSVADLHGDFEAACKVLVSSQLMDLDANWIAGPNTYLIQTGDIVDRGRQSSTTYQLLFDLQDQTCNIACAEISAKEDGECQQSNVVLLYGNHEEMHLSHARHETIEANWLMPQVQRLKAIELEINYQTRRLNTLIEEYLKSAQGSELPEALRSDAAEKDARVFGEVSLARQYGELVKKLSQEQVHTSQNQLVRALWSVESGLLGNEIWRRYQTVVKVGSQAVYVHAGLEARFVAEYVSRLGSAATPNSIVAAINADVQTGLRQKISPEKAEFLFGSAGPLWTREVSQHSGKPQICLDLKRVLRDLDGAALVVGHTPVPPPFESRCETRQILMDVAMSYKMARASPCWLGIAGAVGEGGAEWRVDCFERRGVRSVVAKMVGGGVKSEL